MRGVIIGAALALSVTSAGVAEDLDVAFSANTMLPYCEAFANSKRMQARSAADAADASYCNGMLAMLRYMSSLFDDDHPECMRIPKAATNQQLSRVIVRYVEARPQRMHEPFFDLVVEAFHSAWPCKPREAR